MPRKQKLGVRTHCKLCGSLVTAGNEIRHESKCDRAIEVAFLASLTNNIITIPPARNVAANRQFSNNVDGANQSSTENPTNPDLSNSHQQVESNNKRLRSSSRVHVSTSHSDVATEHHDDYFPSGGTTNSDDMLDVTDFLPYVATINDDPTFQLISQLEEEHRIERQFTQIVDRDIAHSSVIEDRLVHGTLNTQYPVHNNLRPNLTLGSNSVLGVEAPSMLMCLPIQNHILATDDHDHRTEVIQVPTANRLTDDDMADSVANQTDVNVAVNTHPPVVPHDPWNASTSSSPILFPFNDASYHTTTPLDKISMMRLHRCVTDANCPRYFFDKFMRILREEMTYNGFRLDTAPSRTVFVNYFTKKYPTAPPVVRDVPLETDVTDVRNTSPEEYRRRLGDVAKVITFDFKSQLQDLLGDKQIWGDPDNLLINNDDPFSPYSNKSGTLDDVLDGKWYRSTVVDLGIDKKNSRLFLLPIILYMDKTGTDANQRHSLEPVLFTLGVFTRKLRNQTRAWRILGFIPDLQLMSSAVKKAARSRLMGKGIGERNYHTCLRVVLQSFIDCQDESRRENGFLKAWLRIGDYVKPVKLVIPLFFVIGDAKSGDTLCGRFGGYNTKRMSRSCHVSLNQCDNPNHQCQMANSGIFQDLCREAYQLPVETDSSHTTEHRRSLIKIVKRLHSMSQHRHISAFENIYFGNNKRGICGATPTDLMHAFLEGVLKYLLRIVIEPLKEDKKAQLDFLINHMFGSLRSSEMNASTFLKSNFTHGYTNLTMLTADEWAGMTFTLLVSLRSIDGHEIFIKGRHAVKDSLIPQGQRPNADTPPLFPNSLDDLYVDEASDEDVINNQGNISDLDKNGDRIEDICISIWELTEILERLLAFHAFYKRGAPYDWIHPVIQESHIRLMGRQMMDMVVRALPRTDGNGWKIQKLHELLHMASDMAMFGCPQNYDAGPGESSLKTWAKVPARTALKQGAVIFSDSVARRLHESACFSRMERTELSYDDYANQLSQRKLEEDKELDIDIDSDDSDDPTTPLNEQIKSEMIGKPKFAVFLNSETPSLVQSKWLGKQKQKGHVALHPLVLKWIITESFLDPEYPEMRIEGYTEYVRNGVRFRAHPNYRSKGPWHDFVMVAFSADGTNVDHVCQSELKQPPSFDPYAPPFGDQYFPCKILAFLSIPNNLDQTAGNRLVAVVQSCEIRSLIDAAADTRLLQVWTLEYDKKVNDTTGSYREPLVREVDVNSFDQRVLVIEESPGIHEHLMCKPNSSATVQSRRIFLSKDRDKSWAEQYINWNSDLTRRYETSNEQIGRKKGRLKKKG